MTPKQADQFNIMRETLRRIAREYQPPATLQRNSEKQYGLPYPDALEMAYENIQADAADACRGVKAIGGNATTGGKKLVDAGAVVLSMEIAQHVTGSMYRSGCSCDSCKSVLDQVDKAIEQARGT